MQLCTKPIEGNCFDVQRLQLILSCDSLDVVVPFPIHKHQMLISPNVFSRTREASSSNEREVAKFATLAAVTRNGSTRRF
jgi:hypothetical protein